MNFDKHSLLLSLIKNLEKAHVPADKSHIHKTLYLLQEAVDGQLPFEFIYWNGPYSYDVEAELAQMRSYAALRLAPVPGGGTAFRFDHNAAMIEQDYPLDQTQRRWISFVCNFVRSVGKPPIELDRQATVAWIMRREYVIEPTEIIQRFEKLKSSNSREEVERAISLVAEFFRKAEKDALGQGVELMAA